MPGAGDTAEVLEPPDRGDLGRDRANGQVPGHLLVRPPGDHRLEHRGFRPQDSDAVGQLQPRRPRRRILICHLAPPKHGSRYMRKYRTLRESTQEVAGSGIASQSAEVGPLHSEAAPGSGPSRDDVPVSRGAGQGGRENVREVSSSQNLQLSTRYLS